MNEEGLTVSDVALWLGKQIEQCISPSSNNAERAAANHELNEYLKTTIFTDLIRHLKVAKRIIGRIDEASVGDALFNSVKELHVHFGFNILEELIKRHWYHLDAEDREDLKAKCVQWCQTRLFSAVSNLDGSSGFYQGRLATSPLVLNSCSRVATEVFVRDWFQEWPNFLGDITDKCSLVTLHIFFNISDMLHVQVLPQNTQRRKEILKILMQNGDIIYNYFNRCINLLSDCTTENLQDDYKQLVVFKAYESLESWFEWFRLNPIILPKLLNVVLFEDQLNFSQLNSNVFRTHILAFKCIHTILKRTNPSNEDRTLLEDLFYDFDAKKFTNYLICNKLVEFCSFFATNSMEDYPELFELFILVLDITLELMSRILTLLNLETTNPKIRQTIHNNEIGWKTFFSVVFRTLSFDHVCCDEMLLRFLSNFVKLKYMSKDVDCPVSTMAKLYIPEFSENFLSVIRMEAKSQEEASRKELYLGYQVDTYESYLAQFSANRAKLVLILQMLTNKEPDVFRRKLEQVYLKLFETPQTLTSITSWRTAVYISQTILLYLDKDEFLPPFIAMLETVFKTILSRMQEENDVEKVSCMLSCISAMSSVYDRFDLSLLKQLLDLIFYLATIERRWNDSIVMQLQNHVSAFFIKLVTGHIQSYLLPHFAWMRAFFDNQWESKKMSHSMYCNFYDALIILSNKLSIQEQREFLRHFILPKLNWLASYSFGDNGINFFREIGLSKEPNFTVNSLPYNLPENVIFPNIMTTLHFLNRLFKRLDPERLFECLWSEVDIYQSFVVPVYKIVSYIHIVWAKKRATFKTDLDSFCHPFYQNYVFEELPYIHLCTIGAEQMFQIPEDPIKVLRKKWNPLEQLPEPELIGRHMQQRFSTLYSNSIAVLGLSLCNMFHFYNSYSQTHSKIEACLNIVFEPFYVNLHAMPLCIHFELFKHFFNFIAYYAPRNEFLAKSNVLQLLLKFVPSMFAKLNEHIELMKNEQGRSVANSDLTLGSRAMQYGGKQLDKSCQEVIDEKLLHLVCNEFIQFLSGIFNSPKDVKKMFYMSGEVSDYQPDSANEEMEMDQEMDRAHENVTQTTMFIENELLSKVLLDSPERCKIIEVVTGCLLWPFSNLRESIANINVKLLKSLVQRNLLENVEEFYYVAECILRAVMLTDREDFNALNSLANCFLIIYEHVVLGKNLTSIVHPQLSNICNVQESQWNNFAASLDKFGEKKKVRSLRSLIEHVSKQSLSSLHSKIIPKVFALGQPPKAIKTEHSEVVDLSSLF